MPFWKCYVTKTVAKLSLHIMRIVKMYHNNVFTLYVGNGDFALI